VSVGATDSVVCFTSTNSPRSDPLRSLNRQPVGLRQRVPEATARSSRTLFSRSTWRANKSPKAGPQRPTPVRVEENRISGTHKVARSTSSPPAVSVLRGYAKCSFNQAETTSSTAVAAGVCGAGSSPGSSAIAWPMSGMRMIAASMWSAKSAAASSSAGERSLRNRHRHRRRIASGSRDGRRLVRGRRGRALLRQLGRRRSIGM
jgi:hypothetical protein